MVLAFRPSRLTLVELLNYVPCNSWKVRCLQSVPPILSSKVRLNQIDHLVFVQASDFTFCLWLVMATKDQTGLDQALT